MKEKHYYSHFFGLFLMALILTFTTADIQAQCAANLAETCCDTPANFSFTTFDVNPSTCLANLNNSAGFIVMNVVQGGTLNMNVNGNSGGGFIDVAVFAIPPGVNPCAVTAADQLSCNFASSASGCASFGWNGPGQTPTCPSNIGGIPVADCDRILIIAENYSNASVTFDVHVDNTDADNGHVGPTEPDIPDGATCHDSGPYQITNNIDVVGPNAQDGGVDIPANLPAETGADADVCPNAAGGTYTATCGACVNGTTGMFDPAVAGAGTHVVTYEHYTPGAPNCCNATDDATILVDADPDPQLSCPGAPVCANDPAIDLQYIDNNAALATNGAPTLAITGSGAPYVTGNMFDPSAAGPGSYTIVYTLTSVNGICEEAFSCTIDVVQCCVPDVLAITITNECSSPIASQPGNTANTEFAWTNGEHAGGNHLNHDLDGDGVFTLTDPADPTTWACPDRDPIFICCTPTAAQIADPCGDFAQVTSDLIITVSGGSDVGDTAPAPSDDPNAGSGAFTGAPDGNVDYVIQWFSYDPATNMWLTPAAATQVITEAGGVATATFPGIATDQGYIVVIEGENGCTIENAVAWVWIDEDPDVDVQNPFNNILCDQDAPTDLTGTNIAAADNHTFYCRPTGPNLITPSTEITICIDLGHTYQSDVGFILVGPAACGSPNVVLGNGVCCPDGDNDFGGATSGGTWCGTCPGGSGGTFPGPPPGGNTGNSPIAGGGYIPATTFCFTNDAADPTFGYPTAGTGNFQPQGGLGVFGAIAGCDANADFQLIIDDQVGGDCGALWNVTITFDNSNTGGATTIVDANPDNYPPGGEPIPAGGYLCLEDNGSVALGPFASTPPSVALTDGVTTGSGGDGMGGFVSNDQGFYWTETAGDIYPNTNGVPEPVDPGSATIIDNTNLVLPIDPSTDLDPGSNTFFLVGIDAYGCTSVDSVMLLEPEPLQIDSVTAACDCTDDANDYYNTITVEVQGGMPTFDPNQITWSTGDPAYAGCILPAGVPTGDGCIDNYIPYQPDYAYDMMLSTACGDETTFVVFGDAVPPNVQGGEIPCNGGTPADEITTYTYTGVAAGTYTIGVQEDFDGTTPEACEGITTVNVYDDLVVNAGATASCGELDITGITGWWDPNNANFCGAPVGYSITITLLDCAGVPTATTFSVTDAGFLNANGFVDAFGGVEFTGGVNGVPAGGLPEGTYEITINDNHPDDPHGGCICVPFTVTVTGCCPQSTPAAGVQDLCGLWDQPNDTQIADPNVWPDLTLGTVGIVIDPDFSSTLNTDDGDDDGSISGTGDGVDWFMGPDPFTDAPYDPSLLFPVDNCTEGVYTLYAFLRCDHDPCNAGFTPGAVEANPNVTVNDSYIAAGQITVNVFPELYFVEDQDQDGIVDAAFIPGIYPNDPVQCQVEITPSCPTFNVDYTITDNVFGVDPAAPVSTSGATILVDPDAVFGPATLGVIDFTISNPAYPGGSQACISLDLQTDYTCCVAHAGPVTSTESICNTTDFVVDIDMSGANPNPYTTPGLDALYTLQYIYTDQNGVIIDIITDDELDAVYQENFSQNGTVPVLPGCYMVYSYSVLDVAPPSVVPAIGVDIDDVIALEGIEGCFEVSDPINVYVFETADAGTIAGDNAFYCELDDADLGAYTLTSTMTDPTLCPFVTAAYTYQYFLVDVNTGNIVDIHAAGDVDPSVPFNYDLSGFAAGCYELYSVAHYTSTNGALTGLAVGSPVTGIGHSEIGTCVSVSNAVPVTIYDTPDGGAITGQNTFYCELDDADLAAYTLTSTTTDPTSCTDITTAHQYQYVLVDIDTDLIIDVQGDVDPSVPFNYDLSAFPDDCYEIYAISYYDTDGGGLTGLAAGGTWAAVGHGDDLGCLSISNPIPVTIYETPDAGTIAGQDVFFCELDDADLGAYTLTSTALDPTSCTDITTAHQYQYVLVDIDTDLIVDVQADVDPSVPFNYDLSNFPADCYEIYTISYYDTDGGNLTGLTAGSTWSGVGHGDDAGCFATSNPIAVTIYDTPDAGELLGADLNICFNDPILAMYPLGSTALDPTSCVDITTAHQYQFFITDVNGDIQIIWSDVDPSGTYQYDVTSLPVGFYNFYGISFYDTDSGSLTGLQVGNNLTDIAHTDLNGCFDISPAYGLSINTVPNLYAETEPVCQPNTVDIAAPGVLVDYHDGWYNNTMGVVTYHATQADAWAGTPQMSSTVISTIGITTYWIRKESELGCVDVVPVTVAIFPLPDIEAEDLVTCHPFAINLLADALITDHNYTDGTFSFHPTENDAITFGAGLPAILSGVGIYTVWVRSTTPFGCFDVTSFTVTIQDCPGPEPCEIDIVDAIVTDCNDNGTPDDPSDDFYFIDLEVTILHGTDEFEVFWGTSVNDPKLGTFPFDDDTGSSTGSVVLGPFSSGDTSIDIHVTDDDNYPCWDQITVFFDGSCPDEGGNTGGGNTGGGNTGGDDSGNEGGNEGGNEEQGTIDGIVYNDINDDGVQDDGIEPGIEDVMVILYDEDGNIIATTLTDEDGNFSFDDLPAGDYYIEVMIPEGYTVSNDGTGGEQDVDMGATSGIFTVDGTGTVTVDLYAGLLVTGCDNFFASVEIDCDIDSGEYSVIITLSGGDSYVVVSSHATGFNGTANGSFTDGPFANGAGFEYNIFPEGQPACIATLANPSVNCSDPTAIELLNFTGSAIDAGNALNWVSATEIDNALYHLERSTNGVDFARIATLEGAGNSSSELAYEHLDIEAPNGVSYYRLITEDFSGLEEQHPDIVRLERDSLNGWGITQVYPIPAFDRLWVNFNVNSEEPIQVEMLDVLGRIAGTTQLTDLVVGNNTRMLEIAQLPAGAYFLRLSQGTESSIIKFVKK